MKFFVTLFILVFTSLAHSSSCVDFLNSRNNGHFILHAPTPGSPLHSRELIPHRVRHFLDLSQPQEKKALTFLMKLLNSSYVSFETFRIELEKSFQLFSQKNPHLLNSQKIVFFSYEKNKSNFWTTELLVQRGKELGIQSPAHAFINEKTLAKYIKKEGIKDIILTDDASYSGKQFLSVLDFLLPALRFTGATVHVVIPYMTRTAFEKIQKYNYNFLSLPNRFIGEPEIKIYSSQRIPTFNELLSEAYKNGEVDQATIDQLDTMLRYESDSTLLYFDHKIPDAVSSVSGKGSQFTTLHIIESLVIMTPSGPVTFDLVPSFHPPYKIKSF